MSTTRPQEGSESSEQLKSLVERIIAAITKLPPTVHTNPCSDEDCMVTTTREKIKGSEFKYDYPTSGVTEGDHSYHVEIKNNRGESLVTIDCTNSHIIYRHGVDGIASDERKKRLLELTSKTQPIVSVVGDEITLAPKMTEGDVGVVVEFLEKALDKHKEDELKKAREINEAQTATADAVRKSLSFLK